MSSLFIGEGTFSNSSVDNLHASVIEPPPRVRIQSALKHVNLESTTQEKRGGEWHFVERICSAIAIASSHGEFCPTPYFVPTIYGERNSRYCFPLVDRASDLDMTRYGEWTLIVERIEGRTVLREVVKVTLY